MPNPTRAQILNAYEALEELKNVALSAADFCGDTEKYLACKSEILAALPPKPQPTMAEVGWDGDKHRFAEAELTDYGEVIMLNMAPVSGNVRILLNEYGEFRLAYADPADLTPTGKRYTLTEVQE